MALGTTSNGRSIKTTGNLLALVREKRREKERKGEKRGRRDPSLRAGPRGKRGIIQ